MVKFIVRRLLLMLLTMVLVSLAVFAITEAAPGNVARNVLGIQITPAQEASFLAQNGLDKPIYQRYFSWLLGTDWQASRRINLPVAQLTTEDGFTEWWAIAEDGTYIQWTLEGEDLIARHRQTDGTVIESVDSGRWSVKDPSTEIERLFGYKSELESNNQVTDADRQLILENLETVLGVLAEARDGDLEQAALINALIEPESTLESLRDPEILRKKQAFQDMAENVTRKYGILQSVAVQGQLESDVGDYTLSEYQAMARQLDKTAKKLEDLGIAESAQVRMASGYLAENQPQPAMDTLSTAQPVIDRISASIGKLLQALASGDYLTAKGYLDQLSDPSNPLLMESEQEMVAGMLIDMGNELEEDLPPLGTPLSEAGKSLQSGDAASAQGNLSEAAATLVDVGFNIARSDAAGSARVARVFWGVDAQNHAVRWEKGTGEQIWVFIVGTGWKAFTGGPQEYIPLQKGLLRGDPGISLRTGRPVADLLFTRLRNSLVLAGIAFVIVMPLALVLGLIAGLNEGKFLDRALSIGGMMFSVTPEFATGIFLILIFAFWLKLVPGATVFGEDAPWTRPDMLILPVSTLTLIELGYVLRITRASMVEVMKAPYIRTAFLKGLPYRRVVLKHAIRNALMTPITVIMLHVNWLLGGIVVVEVIFGYPGLGSYLLDSALFKDFNAIEGGAIILVAIAVGTQLLADIIYTFLNPRIRYA